MSGIIEIGTPVVAEKKSRYTGEITETITGTYQGYDGDGSSMILQADGRTRYVDHWLTKTAVEHAKIVAAREARKNAPKPELVKCSCGHSVPRGSVMNASMGTSCPDCYDRMS